MLDRIKLMKELQHVSASLFIDLSPTLSRMRQLWDAMVNNPLFQSKVNAAAASRQLPEWEGKLDDLNLVSRHQDPYGVVAVDGSQIYPDKHQGTSCALVNIGSIVFTYGSSTSNVTCTSEPYVMHEDNKDALNEFSAEWINCKRQEFEFRGGLNLTRNLRSSHGDLPALFFFDGSLIFWHLEAKEPALKEFFLDAYITQLHTLSQENILIAGYISLPKAKDLVNLVRFYIDEHQSELSDEQQERLDHVVDTNLVNFFLQPNERTNVFKSNSPITRFYPQHLKPYFFYLHVGNEIGRVEIPAWIAQDTHHVDLIATMILDQCVKGDGYPIGLAESHELAVIKGPDREFFYTLLTKLGIEQERNILISRKSLKKRGIAI